MVPLSYVDSGRTVEIVDFRCGRVCSSRLQEIGIVKGSRYRISSGANDHAFILSNGDNRIALGFGIAEKVMVREVPDE